MRVLGREEVASLVSSMRCLELRLGIVEAPRLLAGVVEQFGYCSHRHVGMVDQSPIFRNLKAAGQDARLADR